MVRARVHDMDATVAAHVQDPTERGYRSPGALGTWLVVVLAVLGALSAAATTSSIVAWRLASRVVTEPETIAIEELRRSDERQQAFAVALTAVALVAIALFVAWTRRSYRNLRPLGAIDLRYEEGWAVGAWFVPILNLVRPKQILDDIWRATEVPRPRWWRRGSVPALLHVWWAACVMAGAAWWLARDAGLAGRFHPDAEPPAVGSSLGDVAAFNGRSAVTQVLVADILVAVVAVLSVVVVRRMTRRMRAAYAACAASGPDLETAKLPPARTVDPGGSAGQWRRRVLVGVTVAVIAIAIAIAATSGTDEDHEPETETVSWDELNVGDCILEPEPFGGGVLILVQRVPCVEEHTHQVVARSVIDGADGTPYPGAARVRQIANDECAARVAPFVELGDDTASLELVSVSPSNALWEIGDRGVVCMLHRTDGAPLTDVVPGAAI